MRAYCKGNTECERKSTDVIGIILGLAWTMDFEVSSLALP